jgi:hypothetical protein
MIDLDIFNSISPHIKIDNKKIKYLRYVESSQTFFEEFGYKTEKWIIFINIILSGMEKQEIETLLSKMHISRKIINSIQLSIENFKNAYELLNNTNIEIKKDKNKSLSFDVSQEIRRVRDLLDNREYKVANNQKEEQVRSYYLSYVLGLSTGRRFTEIMKTVSIQKRGDKYVYSGILKKKDSLKNQSLNSYVIELSYKEINAYIKELREYLNGKLLKDKKISLEEVSEDKINTIFSRVYNNAVNRISGKKVPNFHELRHIYTVSQQERYISSNPHLESLSKEDLEVVLRNVRYTVLGHELKADTTFSYVVIK